MPTATLAQKIADRYHLDVAEVDRILHTDDDCGKGWEGQKGHCVRSKSEHSHTVKEQAIHGGVHLAENVVAWKTGRVLGGAIASVAASHGLNHEAARLISETAVQALTATALYARDAKNRTPQALATKFIAEAAAAFGGKAAHGDVGNLAAVMGASHNVEAIAAIVAGKVTGIGVNTAAIKTGVAAAVATRFLKQGKQLQGLINRHFVQPAGHTDSRDAKQLNAGEQERSALFDLTMAGWAIASKLKTQPKQDAAMIHIDATQTELDIYKEVGKDLQEASGGGIRYRSAKVTGPSRIEGVFTSTRDGKAYSFVWQSGKVTYQPVVAKTDSMTDYEHELKWLKKSIQLDNAGGETRVDSLRLHLDATRNCGQGSYFCKAGGSGTCIGVHKACSNDKQAVNHDRLNKINALIQHLQAGGEHPSKALDKPDAAKLQTVAEGIQKTRDLRAANLVAKRAGDRMAMQQQNHRIANMTQNEFMEGDRFTNPLLKQRMAAAHKEIVEKVLQHGMVAKGVADYPDLAAKYGKAKPATMTVGAIASSTKPPQLIPQSKVITPEVLPSEVPRRMRSRAEKEADFAKIKANLEEAAKGVANTAILQHAAYQTALGGDVSPESIRQAQQASSELAVAKLKAGNQQKALLGSGGKRVGTKAAIAAAQQGVKEAVTSTAKAASAHQEFMQTAMQMAKESGRQSRSITPEVLPPETPREGAKKRIAGLLDKLQENHEAGTKNAAQISTVAHTALQGLDPTHTPQLSTSTASTYEPPKGSGRQRVAKLMGDLQANHEADVKNAAATYAVAQSAVNQLAAQEAGQKASPKQLSGQTGKEGVGGEIGVSVPPEFAETAARLRKQADKSYYGSVRNLDGQHRDPYGTPLFVPAGPAANRTVGGYSPNGHAPTFLSENTKDAIRDYYEKKRKGLNNDALRDLSWKVSKMERDDMDAAKKHGVHTVLLDPVKNPSLRQKKGLESAPLAPKTKPRKAGDDPNYKGKHGHITIDSITSAIARLQQRGTHIDSATVLELLRRVDDCSCDECQHKDEMSSYDRLVKSLAAKGVDDPKALAAYIGRKKLGKKRFQARAAAGARRAARV